MFGPQVGLSEVVGAVATLESVMAVFEPGTLSGDDAASLMDTFAKGERICATGKALCAKRATDTALHRREGHSNPATLLAQRTGDSVGDAVSALCTAEAASSLPHLDAALRAGELSADRARQVAEGASADPDAEAALIAAAKSSPMRALPGCEVDYGLEIDHWQVDVAADGPTCLANLCRLCHHHHLPKTHRGWRLAGGQGNWSWLAPPGPAPMGSQGPAPPPGCRASPGAAGQPSLFDTATDP